MTGEVELLTPISARTVLFYTCGLTVYSQPHIGNWLGYIYWDVLQRTLIADGYDVIRTQNITDVGHLTSDDDNGEDKMQKGATREGITAWDVAKKYTIIASHEAYELLDLLRPTHLVSATSLIHEQIAFAEQLEQKGFTYSIPDEGLYFDTAKLSDYGKLARLDVAGLEAGKRVAVAGKKHITDFAIWKCSPTNQTRDMQWDSPWGMGFPGWHLECSTIARQTLGDRIDIHAGGIDHIPVHHTNEIAQTESLTNQPFANIWIHNNHIKIDGRKISKSLGNIVSLQDILERGYTMDAFKVLVLSKHYATEGNFSWEIMEAAQHRLDNWRNVAALRHQTHGGDSEDADIPSLAVLGVMKEALNNNLNTPRALSAIDELFSTLTSVAPTKINHDLLVDVLVSIDSLLGLHLLETTPDIPDEAKQAIVERTRARELKQWERSDQLRDELMQSYNITLLDSGHGIVWQYN